MNARRKNRPAYGLKLQEHQFQWYFRYPGADGVLAGQTPRSLPKLMRANPLGIDPNES